MCELFGFSANNTKIINDYLRSFYHRSDMHPHGWGLAYMFDGEMSIEKEARKATESHYLSDLLSMPINTKSALAHIRFATVGNMYRRNCHPYSKKDNFGRRWTLIHNGTIFEYPALNKYIDIQHGETDTERMFLYFLENINSEQAKLHRPLRFSERFALLDGLIGDLSRGNKLNLIFFDGEYLYVHSNYHDSLHYLRQDGALIFATHPLTRNNWSDLKLNTLFAVKDGEFVTEGYSHKNEFFDDEEAYKNLFLDYSQL